MLNWVLSWFGRVWCDRRHSAVKGCISGVMSAGVYVGWTQYMDPGEHVVCDRCMWSDERYLAGHSYMRGAK